MVGLGDLIDATHLNKDELKAATIGMLIDCLIPAFLSLRELRKVPTLTNVPQVTIFKHFDDLYRTLWTAFSDRLPKICKAAGVDISFVFAPPTKFPAAAQAFAAKYPSFGPEFFKMIEGDRSTWQLKLADLRNHFLEHQKVSREMVAEFYRLDKADLLFENVWNAIEDIVAHTLETHFPPGIHLAEIPPEERDPKNPRRFQFSADPGMFPPGSTVP